MPRACQSYSSAYAPAVRVHTIGHGRRPLEELVAVLAAADVRTLVDVRRFPGSRRNPQFNQATLADALREAGIAYRHALELGGRLSGEPGEEDFACITVPAFRRYAARMRSTAWQDALAAAVAQPAPCFMCAETPWWRCHRRLIAELLHARGLDVVHLLSRGHADPHRPWEPVADVRKGIFHLCGRPVA